MKNDNIPTYTFSNLPQTNLFQEEADLKDGLLIEASKSKNFSIFENNVYEKQKLNAIWTFGRTKNILTDLENQNQNENEQKFGSLIFSPNNQHHFQKHLMKIYKELQFSKNFLIPPTLSEIKNKIIRLKDPKYPKFKTLFVELDEVLIHQCTKYDKPDKYCYVLNEQGEKKKVYFYVRPYCLSFLCEISLYFEIYAFTSSSHLYASAIIQEIDSNGKIFSGLISKKSCLKMANDYFVKDLRIIGNREMKNMILVDSSVHSFGFQIHNGIPIDEFIGDRNDCELEYLKDFLINGAREYDSREYLKQHLKLDYLVEKCRWKKILYSEENTCGFA